MEYVSSQGRAWRKPVLVFSLGIFVAFVAALAILVGDAGARVPQGFSQSKVVGGLSKPTAMAFAPDGRIFVAEQGGRLRVVDNGRVLYKPFVTLKVDSRGERGLLGVTLDPNFATNRYVYVYHTVPGPKVHNRVTRFTASGSVAASGSRKTILDINALTGRLNHNGGAIHFGEDGKLYVAVGENADKANSQTLSNLKGKMLRINSDGTIPQDNPFYDQAEGNNRAIWALGLRNPYSFAIQRGTGQMFINDVGQKRFEEINVGRSGANYGWPKYEGPESSPDFQGPRSFYRHGNTSTTGCAITGGAFYNPNTRDFPSGFVGDYFFADFCNGWIRRLDAGTGKTYPFATTPFGTTDVQVGPKGNLHYLSIGTNALHRINYGR